MNVSAFVTPISLRRKPPDQYKSYRQTCPQCNSQINDNNDDEELAPQISTNWREFRAAMVAGSLQEHENHKTNAYRTGHWAHPLSLPETGCFLASHPAYYRRKKPYLTQSVVFLTHYDIKTGATGLVLNRPLQGNASELEESGLFGRSSGISKTEFYNQPVYMGGPNTPEKGILSIVHSDIKVGGFQPLDGVFLCDVEQYLSLNSQEDADKSRLFFGCIRWEPGVLEGEVDEGSWYCVSASEQFVLKHCINLPVPLWREIMVCQGGIFEQIGNRTFNDSPDQDSNQK